MSSIGEKLYGTNEPPATWRTVQAGPLSVDFENGQLRYVRFGVVEVLRAISFLARDRYWGTFGAEIDSLEVNEQADCFEIRYRGQCAPGEGDLRYEVEIVGEASGRLSFRAWGTPLADFTTNRLGFVVLHPLGGVAGAEVELEHSGRGSEVARLPELISPHEPARELSAITHRAGDLKVRVEMVGDDFDMEDQRNWTDASFKTYIRPLSRPKPYTIPAGERFEQSIAVTVSGRTAAESASDSAAAVSVGEPIGTIPAIGLALEGADVQAATEAAAWFGWLSYLIGRPAVPSEAERLVAVARLMGATLELQFAIPAANPAAELKSWAAVGQGADAVLVTPYRIYPLRPAGVELGDASLAAIAGSVRAAFPKARVGGGVLTGFTEFNRNRPPADAVDYVGHATTAIVHAADDRSVVESLDTLPYVFRSATALSGGKSYRVGPSSIGMALDPDGPPRFTDSGRATMVRNDPRQRGLFAAAWTLGYLAAVVPFGSEIFSPGFVLGDLGLVDGQTLRPVYHVVRAMALAQGGEVRAVGGLPAQSVGLSFAGTIWIANLSAESLDIDLGSPARTATLDADSFERASLDDTFMDVPTQPAAARIILGPYAVVRVWP
jgi:hypothetical protein